MNDMSSQPMNIQASQRRVSYAFANDIPPNVVNADAERNNSYNTIENDSQQQNTKISINKIDIFRIGIKLVYDYFHIRFLLSYRRAVFS